MIAYRIITREDCGISCSIEGQHVAAALDQLLQAKIEGTALRVPYLAEGLLGRIGMLRAVEIIKAASNGGCMPSMVLVALERIKARALFWHRKAVKFAMHEESRLAKLQEARDASAAIDAAIAAAAGETSGLAPDLTTVVKPRKRRAKEGGIALATSVGGKRSR